MQDKISKALDHVDTALYCFDLMIASMTDESAFKLEIPLCIIESHLLDCKYDLRDKQRAESGS